jgi:hypothetical protein
MRLAARLVALLVVLAVVPVAPALPSVGSGSIAAAQSTADPAGQSGVDADAGTVIDVQLYENGSARWTVETYYTLETANETRAFESYRRPFENGSAGPGTGFDVTLFRNAAARAAEASGRPMSIPTDTVAREAVVANGTGVLRLSFVWENFLERSEDGRLVLEDAFRTPDNGTWLGSLQAGQRLVVESPPGYDIAFNPGFQRDGSRIIIDGDRYRGDRDLRFSYVQAGPAGLPIPPWLAVAVGLVLVGLVAAGWYVRGGGLAGREGDGADGPTATAGTSDGGRPVESESGPGSGSAAEGTAGAGATGAGAGSDARGDRHGDGDGRGRGDAAVNGVGARSSGSAGGAGTGPDADTPSASAADTDAGAGTGDGEVDPDTGTGGGSGPAAEPGGDSGDEPEPDLELLSDEERVEYLLESNGGRMKQANIVSETGWSDAKVSQLLSSMAEDGRVDKLRLGRENLISLPDDDGGEDDGDGGGAPTGPGR